MENTSASILIFILLAAGIFYFLWKEKVEIDIDKEKRFVKIKKTNRFRSTLRLVAFDSIETIFVRKIGREHKGIAFYLVMFELVSGENISTGSFFTNRGEAQSQADLWAYEMGTKSHQMPFLPSAWDFPLPIAFGVSLLFYVIYYRLTVGPLCPAMWFGTLPPFFIGASTLTLFLTLKSYSRK